MMPASSLATSVTILNGGSVVQSGVFVGPYQLSVDGNPLSAVCDDFYHDLFVGDTWTATARSLTTANLQFFEFGNPANPHLAANPMAFYAEAAYLTSLFLTHPQADWGAIHFAIWGLFDPAVSSASGYTAAAAAWANQAVALYTGAQITLAQFAGYQVLTANTIPPDGRGPQEFAATEVHRFEVRQVHAANAIAHGQSPCRVGGLVRMGYGRREDAQYLTALLPRR